MSGESMESSESREKVVVNRLIARCDEFLKKGQHVASPVKKKTKSKSKSSRPGRMTEKEEDEIIMADELEEMDSNHSKVVSRLQVQPSNIAFGTMRDYQLEGLNWLISLWKNGISGILADEMGLGKTLQSISILAYLKLFQNINGPHLVVVPLTTLGNWMNEFKRWCPSLKTFKFHGDKEERAVMLRDQFDVRHREWDVCVTSYEMVNKHISQLKKYDFEFIIVDEAHRLKNENSSLSKTLRFIKSKNRLLLTGTPLQNNLHELWALLNFLLPDVFHSSEEFDEIFSDETNVDKSSVMEQLHKILRPFMLRRLKIDVEKSLLPKKETLVFVGMSEVQKKLYLSIFHKNMDAVRGISKQQTALLNTIMQLRKVANHPYLFDGVEDRSLPLYGDHLITNSGKVVVLDKLLVKLKKMGSRVLIFSQMTRVLDILEDYCFYRGHDYCRIDGNTNTLEREQRMQEFNADGSNKFLFLLSTRAGGLGINLYTADVVILYDSDWNPQMDLQAQDRAHRIGQKKQVYVYRFLTEGTIEEKIIERAEIKLKLDAMVIQQGRMASKNKMTKTDMLEMIRYGADNIFRSKECTITDEDIDLILARGEELTNQRNEKLKKHIGGELKFDASAATFMQDDIDNNNNNVNDQFDDLILVNQLHDALGKRERKLRHKDMNEGNYYRDALNAGNGNGSGGRKQVKIYDWQFCNEERLKILNDKENDYKRDNRHVDNAPETNLTAAEIEERKELSSFLHFKHTDFRAYIRALERFGRNDIDSISNLLKETRPNLTEEDVRNYHIAFWVKYEIISGHERILKTIERAETNMKRSAELRFCLQYMMEKIESKHQALTNLTVPYAPNLNHKGFSKNADKFLLYATYKLGYGAWSELAEEVSKTPEFTFDYFFRSRTSADLSRRVESLLRIGVKDLAKKNLLHVKRKNKVGNNDDNNDNNDIIKKKQKLLNADDNNTIE